MDKKIRIYDLKDDSQYEDEIAYWKTKSASQKLHALELIRKTALKLKGTDGDEQRLRRVFRIVE